MPIVPIDPRPQFSFVDLAVANAVHGGPSLDQVEQVGEDRYVLSPPSQGWAGITTAVRPLTRPTNRAG
jgi:hypothetical protein